MSTKPRTTAAGAVVLRERKGQTEVLLVHRPRYKDWSLPKGKPRTDEDLPATAVRELEEETGVTARLGLPLGTTRYQVKGQLKVVHWWLAHPVAIRRHRKDHEVDKVSWMPLDKAARKLSYASDRKVLERAIGLPETGTILVVRHGKAMLRKHWTGTDAKRPISARGRRQARRVVGLLAAYGTDELVSSSSTRCLQTLQPASDQLGLPISGIALLSEEEAADHSRQVRRLMRTLATRVGEEGSAMAICGHRPVLPDMREGLGVPNKPMLTGETLVVHLDAKGFVVATETHKSAY